MTYFKPIVSAFHAGNIIDMTCAIDMTNDMSNASSTMDPGTNDMSNDADWSIIKRKRKKRYIVESDSDSDVNVNKFAKL
jgi:hypothetical protein